MLGARTWCVQDFCSTPLLSSFQIQTLHLSMRSLSFSPTSFRAFSALALSFCRTPLKNPRPTHPPRFSVTSLLGKEHFQRFAAASQSRSSSPVFERLESNKDGEELRPSDSKSLPSVPVEVKELQDVPEQWRRARLAWLCKELPSHKPATFIRILNGQRKWMKQEDATYVVVHFMRIRENEASFRVYKWMIQRPWFQFDFALATKLADYLGKEQKFSKCRDVFDQIVNQGHVPSESTFHILTVAYLSAPIQGCLEEAFTIYNQMIQFGGYSPQLSLHNSLFRALVSKPGGSSKSYLKQAEFIFHNLVTSGLEIHKEVYAGLIWLHSYQDVIDMARIAALREEMHCKGIEEGKDVLISVMRACAKEGNLEEAERTWIKILESGCGLPSQAFVYRMEVYAKIGQPMKSLGIFREMQDLVASTSVIAYHKIIEVMSKAQEMEIAETLLREFIDSGLKSPIPAFVDIMTMYSDMGLHDKVESSFSLCLSRCRPNRNIYNIYLDSLVSTGNIEKAEETLNEMQTNTAVGVNSRSCNIILGGYLASGEFIKAEKVYDVMCQKKFDVDPPLMEKIDYVLSLNRKVVKKPISMKLDKEQREILIGILLGGVRIHSDEERRNHTIYFEFNEKSDVHRFLKKHIHECYHEWLNSASRVNVGDDEIPCCFSTISHSYFGFFADQFWPKGRCTVPKLIHRWLSARVLAYWYMYGGHRSSSGDILLKLKGANHEDLERIIKTLKAKSLECRVKRKGSMSWIAFQGSNAAWFWKLTEPYILDDLKYILSTNGQTPKNGASDDQYVRCDSESDSDEVASGCSGDETVFDCVQRDSAQDILD